MRETWPDDVPRIVREQVRRLRSCANTGPGVGGKLQKTEGSEECARSCAKGIIRDNYSKTADFKRISPSTY